MAEEFYGTSDFPIGHVEEHRYGTSEASLARDDVLLVMSDGLVEASRGGEPFGLTRSKAECVRILGEKGRLELDDLVGAVHVFLDGDVPEDDICLMSLTFHGSGG